MSVHRPVTGFVFPHILCTSQNAVLSQFHNYFLGGTKFKALFINLTKVKI
jgi:hypothetical protein